MGWTEDNNPHQQATPSLASIYIVVLVVISFSSLFLWQGQLSDILFGLTLHHVLVACFITEQCSILWTWAFLIWLLPTHLSIVSSGHFKLSENILALDKGFENLQEVNAENVLT